MLELLKDFIGKGEWRKSWEILEYLHSQGWCGGKRKMEKQFEQIKRDYIHGLSDYTIASDSARGYILTRNPRYISVMAKEYIKRGKECLSMGYGVMKRRGLDDQIRLNIKGIDISLPEIISAFSEVENG